MDKIKWAYTRCALLFAISILITWVPASVNRVHGLRYPTQPSFALNIGSAVVLPLQGFWNSVIYFWTSARICKECWRDFKARRSGWELDSVQIEEDTDRDSGATGLGGGVKVDSVLELNNRSSTGSCSDSFHYG